MIRALVLVALVAAGCGGSGGAGDSGRPEGSAVWVDPRVAILDSDQARVLGAAGLEEAFLEAADLAWDGDRPRLDEVPGALDAVPRGTPVTLVLRGSAGGGSGGADREADPRASGRELADALRTLRLRAEGEGLLPVGFHLEIEAVSPELVSAIRREAGLPVSVGIARERLRDPDTARLARSTDAVVVFLYGQQLGAPDDPAAWDPERLREDLQAMDALEVPYLVGLHVAGWGHHLDPAGQRRATTTRAGLKTLAENPLLRLAIDDPFAGVGRLVHTFQAQGATEAAGWQLAPGESVRVVRTAPALVQDVLRRVDEFRTRHHLGAVFHRAATPDERLCLDGHALAAALSPEPARPDLHASVVVHSHSANSVVFEVELENRSRQSTDLAASHGNYLRLEAREGYFGRVEPGEFSRYRLWRNGREARPGLEWREPDEVRFYTPMVRGGERIGRARATLHRPPGSDPPAWVSGKFFSPDGRELELPRLGGPVSRLIEGRSELGVDTEPR